MARSAYEVARLAYSDVVRWTKILEEIRTGEKYIALSYEDARRSIEAFHRSGDVDVIKSAVADLRQKATIAVEERYSRQPRNNAEVLEGYLRHFARPYREFCRDMPPAFDTYAIDIEGLKITGKPHFSVRAARGKEKFIYLLTSKSMTADEKGLLVSILAEIVVSKVPGSSTKDVEGLDCRTGDRIVRNGLGSKLRSRVEHIARHLVESGLAA